MQRAQVEERLAEARVKIGRRQVVAPIDGTVLRLRYHTIGGVVEPAEEILEIVPDNDVLVAEARISPNDIDIVRAGLDARVVLSAYKRRNTPQLNGRVLQISPDVILDAHSSERSTEERRVGKEWVSTWRSRWSADHLKNTDLKKHRK